MSLTDYPNGVSSFGIPLLGGAPLIVPARKGSKAYFVDGTNGNNGNTGLSLDQAFATITKAESVSAAGDIIFVSPGSYDEAVTINTSTITLVGLGGRGSAAIAPTATNATAITISGTAASRTQEVTLVNIGAESNGTGVGLLLQGNLRRIRAYQCKIENGTDSLKMESTAAGSVGDTRFEDCEFAWGTNGVHITASGGGDPVTQTVFKSCLFHNQTTDVIKTSVSHTADLWVVNSVFSAGETGTEPTQYLDIDEASTTGLIAGNYFATSLWSTAKFAIASGVLVAGNYTEAESGGGAASGTTGRPDA